VFDTNIKKLFTKGSEVCEHLAEVVYNPEGRRIGHRPKTLSVSEAGNTYALMRVGDPAKDVTRDMWVNQKNVIERRV